jgi:hypothetical protein
MRPEISVSCQSCHLLNISKTGLFILSPLQADDSEMRPEPVIRAEPVYRLLPLPPGAGHHREFPLRDSHQYR